MTGKTELVPTDVSTGVVDDPGRLEKAAGWLEVFPLPEDAPVLQLGQALRSVEGVDGPGEHQQLVLRQLLLDGKVVHVQPDRDVLVVEQHFLKHGRVAILGKCLIGKTFLSLLLTIPICFTWKGSLK